MKFRVIICCVLVSFLLVETGAQDQAELNRLGDKINHHLAIRMPGWEHKQGEPIKGSKGVLVEFWSTKNRTVKISIVPLKSEQEARQKLQNIANETKEAKQVKDLGDEAYSWGFENSNIVLRRGRAIVFLSTFADVDSDSDSRTLSHSERRARQYSEMKRLSREFAMHMVSAIDLP